MANIPDIEPADLTAGDSASWTRTLPDYPASAGWTLSYTMINAVAKITLNSVANGDDYAVSIAANDSASWVAGDYDWQAYVTRNDERVTVGRGRVRILPNLAAATTLDNRSTMRRALEALEAAYFDYISNHQGHLMEYQIAGRTVKFRNAADIWMQIEKLRKEVAKEDAAARLAAGLPSRRRVLVRFGG
jgi:hypothetical protein